MFGRAEELRAAAITFNFNFQAGLNIEFVCLSSSMPVMALYAFAGRVCNSISLCECVHSAVSGTPS
jgi:hypothetical protein